MDKQPLNTGEQKDMTEFFTDLITKIEEMSPDLVSLCDSLYLFNIGKERSYFSKSIFFSNRKTQ